MIGIRVIWEREVELSRWSGGCEILKLCKDRCNYMGRQNMLTEMSGKSSLAFYRDTKFRKEKKSYSVAGSRNVEA